MKVKRIIGIAVALVFMLSVFPKAPLSVKAETTWTVPEGYSEYEYNKLAAFLEIEDEDGVKNGVKLNEDYDVDDPSTWDDGWVFIPSEEPYHVMFISWNNKDLVGSLDISGFTELSGLYLSNNNITSVDASNCPELGDVECAYGAFQSLDFSNCESLSNLICDDNQLTYLNVRGCTGLTGSIICDNNLLTELDIRDCTQLNTLVCSNNKITDLNVSNCAALTTLNAENNELEQIDLHDCTSLKVLNLSGNKFRSLDMTGISNMYFDMIHEEADGSIGYWQTLQGSNKRIIMYAYPDEGETFLGWYDEEDTQLSTEAEWNVSDVYSGLPSNVIAKFTETNDEPHVTLRGDADCNGIVNIADALAAMRHTMNIIHLFEQGALNADMDGSGSVDTTDALAIMRLALLSNN